MASAVVVDQWPLFRLGIAGILEGLDIHVLLSSSRAGEANRTVRDEGADFYIVGKCSDLKTERVIRDMKKVKPAPKLVVMVDRAEESDVSRLLSLGADALLLRSAPADEFSQAVLALEVGERVVAPSLATGQLGRVGPSVHISEEEAVNRSGLSPKELEVLSVLAEGATYEQIAEALIVGKATVKTHLVHIYAKLEVKNREQAVARALALGLLS